MTYGWGALGFCLLAAGAGSAFAGVRAVTAWRDLRELQRALAWGAADLAGRMATAERRLAELPRGLDELAAAQGRLAASLARARAVERAARDALSPVDALRSAIPRKR